MLLINQQINRCTIKGGPTDSIERIPRDKVVAQRQLKNMSKPSCCKTGGMRCHQEGAGMMTGTQKVELEMLPNGDMKSGWPPELSPGVVLRVPFLGCLPHARHLTPSFHCILPQPDEG